MKISRQRQMTSDLHHRYWPYHFEQRKRTRHWIRAGEIQHVWVFFLAPLPHLQLYITDCICLGGFLYDLWFRMIYRSLSYTPVLCDSLDMPNHLRRRISFQFAYYPSWIVYMKKIISVLQLSIPKLPKLSFSGRN